MTYRTSASLKAKLKQLDDANERIKELERQLCDCKADLDSEVIEGDALRVNDAAIRELCRPSDDEQSTLDLVRSTITHLKTEIEEWMAGSEIEAREADKGRALVAKLSKPCEGCGHPHGNCMKRVAEHILNLPLMREVLEEESQNDQPTKDV